MEEFAEHKVSDYVLKSRSKQKRFSEYILSHSDPIGWFLKLMKSSFQQSHLFVCFHVSNRWLKILIYFQKNPQNQQVLYCYSQKEIPPLHWLQNLVLAWILTSLLNTLFNNEKNFRWIWGLKALYSILVSQTIADLFSAITLNKLSRGGTCLCKILLIIKVFFSNNHLCQYFNILVWNSPYRIRSSYLTC